MANPIRLAVLLLGLFAVVGLARAAGDCGTDDWRADCIAERALAAIAPLPADERPSVVATLLAVHLNQHREPAAELVAVARRLSTRGSAGDRLQLILPLGELAYRTGDKATVARLRRQADSLIAGLAGRRQQPQTYLQIADACVGLTEMHAGAPVLAPPWAGLYGRYCKPAFFARLKAADGFSRVVRRQLDLVAHYLVQDRAAFAAGLPEMILTLRAVSASMLGVDMKPAEREAGVVITGAMIVSLGALACQFDLEAECHAILLGVAMPDEVDDPKLWSSWAAVEAVRGEGLAVGGRVLEGVGALNWLLARAAEPQRRSHQAVFLASAAWLADRLQALKSGRRVLQAI